MVKHKTKTKQNTGQLSKTLLFKLMVWILRKWEKLGPLFGTEKFNSVPSGGLQLSWFNSKARNVFHICNSTFNSREHNLLILCFRRNENSEAYHSRYTRGHRYVSLFYYSSFHASCPNHQSAWLSMTGRWNVPSLTFSTSIEEKAFSWSFLNCMRNVLILHTS